MSGVTLHESWVWGERLPRESKPDPCPSDFCPSLHNGLGFKLAIHVAGEALIFSVFTFKCDRFCLSCLAFLSLLLSILFFSHPLSCTLLPSLSPFLITVCGCELAQGGFFVRQGEYICTLDYQRLYGTRCFSCQDFIEGEVVSALGKTYHPRCFVCSSCK